MNDQIPFLEQLKHDLLEHAPPQKVGRPSLRSRFRLRGAWAAAAAFIVVLVVGGLTWILAGGGSSSPVADAPELLDSFSSGDVVYEFRTHPNSEGPEAPCVGVEYDLETGGRRATMVCPTEASEEFEYASHVHASPWTFVVGYGLEAGETIAVDDATRVVTTEEINGRRFFLIQFGQPVDESFQVPVTRPDGTTRFIAVITPDDTPPSTTSTVEPGSLSESILNLLDGSILEFVGPSEVELTGYLFTIDVPGVGSSNVDLTRGVDPADSAAVVQDAVLEENLGGGVRLWRADREGQPFYLSVDLGGWGAFLHVGNETAPDAELLRSVAGQLRGEANDNGVVLDDYSPEFFTTYLSDPSTQNQIHLGANQCVREVIPGAEVVEDPRHGEVIRGDGYASWCDRNADVEVTVYGHEQFVERIVSGVSLDRRRPAPKGETHHVLIWLSERDVSDSSVGVLRYALPSGESGSRISGGLRGLDRSAGFSFFLTDSR